MTDDPLLPAEAALLIEPTASSAGKCLQAALLTLLGRGHIAIEEEGRFLRHRFIRLRRGDRASLPRHLATIKNSLEVHAIGGRLKSSEVVRALQKSFGNNFRRYVHEILAPALISRGLLRREDRKWLGLIPYAHYQRTATGDARAAPLLSLVDDIGDLKRIIRRDPDRAIRLAQAAGVLLVLSPAARAQVPKLKEIFQDRGGDSAGVPHGDAGDDDSSPGWEVGVDLGDFGFSADVGGFLDGLGAVGDFTGGDGGGDGGDGGGGGD